MLKLTVEIPEILLLLLWNMLVVLIMFEIIFWTLWPILHKTASCALQVHSSIMVVSIDCHRQHVTGLWHNHGRWNLKSTMYWCCFSYRLCCLCVVHIWQGMSHTLHFHQAYTRDVKASWSGNMVMLPHDVRRHCQLPWLTLCMTLPSSPPMRGKPHGYHCFSE